ncbi:hypothetical protein ZOSMA_76G00320 [Zostera marina]|uniref:Pentatricopeptide repeat-containing protein n=1 Tax=Zostera marina TaxID=29655 RepID=A0A0K9NNY9_ZOSMR|nr:hypothetical protein ZOSMA_76G00320 [Zostera marina]
MDAAFSLLCEIPKQGCTPNTKTYSTLMHGLCKQNRVAEAIELCHEMEEKDVCTDTITFNILISGLCERGRIHEGMEFMDKMKLSRCYPNSATYQATFMVFWSRRVFWMPRIL